MYSASVVDKATHLCNLDCQDTTPPAKVVRCPYVNFLESTSSAMSASVYLTNIGSSLPKHKHLLVLSLKYLNIHFIAFQCSSQGLDKNRLTTPIVWAISRLVQIMAYIRLLNDTIPIQEESITQRSGVTTKTKKEGK